MKIEFIILIIIWLIASGAAIYYTLNLYYNEFKCITRGDLFFIVFVSLICPLVPFIVAAMESDWAEKCIWKKEE